MNRWVVHHGRSEELMPGMAEASIEAIVTDPPYHLNFMGKAWDGGDIAHRPEFWELALRVAKPGAHLAAFGGTRTFHRLTCAIEDVGWEIRDCLMWVYGSGFPKSHNLDGAHEGWGTALKPAWEPIILARKPLAGTVAENMAKHGVGAVNIDGCRIETPELLQGSTVRNDIRGGGFASGHKPNPGDIEAYEQSPLGRWPANLIHDGSPEVLAAFPHTESGKPAGVKAGGQGNAFGMFAGGIPVTGFGDAGSAARFFYCAKADRDDRNDGLDGMPEKPLHWSSGDQSPGTFQSEGTKKRAKNNHPTVKPTALMQWLCRLVTPPGGTVFDPFTGSGSTGRGAVLEGFNFVGCECEAEYVEIARRRIAAAAPLFGVPQ